MNGSCNAASLELHVGEKQMVRIAAFELKSLHNHPRDIHLPSEACGAKSYPRQASQYCLMSLFVGAVVGIKPHSGVDKPFCLRRRALRCTSFSYPMFV